MIAVLTRTSTSPRCQNARNQPSGAICAEIVVSWSRTGQRLQQLPGQSQHMPALEQYPPKHATDHVRGSHRTYCDQALQRALALVASPAARKI
eukprot:1165346-Rhodomonas_salina.2